MIESYSNRSIITSVEGSVDIGELDQGLRFAPSLAIISCPLRVAEGLLKLAPSFPEIILTFDF
jgi:hypothetical protein